MKVSVALALILTLWSGLSLGYTYTQEEQEIVNELIAHKDEIRISIVNSLFGKNLPKPKQTFTCTLCESTMLIVLNWIRQGMSDEALASNIKGLCKTLDIAPPDTCDQVVDQYIDSSLYIVHANEWLTRFDICGVLLGGGTDEDCRNVNSTMIDWDITIPGNKPALVERPYLPEDIPTTKVLHLTDVHPDLHYVTGSLADCGNFLCCRPHELDDPSNASISAGPWGDYRDCDMPLSGVEVIFKDAATRHDDAEFIIMTGDLTHHQVWNYTIEDNLDHYRAVETLFKQEFPGKTIYPVIGNHEPVPCNMFPTQEITAEAPEHDITWVYTNFADAFGTSLTPEADASFRKAGYYTLIHKPGFRIIALNTNFCYTNNFWIIHRPRDPEGQLQWLSDTLDAAEKANEVVWIIGHVPPGGDDCWFYWGQKYVALINRYEAIIRAQFYGHTHNDDLRIFFDMTEDPPRPTGSLFITTSVTPYSYVNPGYKVFYADGSRDAESTWEIVDHETYIYNVTEANLGGASQAPTLFKEYSAKEAYGVKSFRPADLFDLVANLLLDDSLFQKFYKFWQMSYDHPEGCFSVECKLEQLCRIVNTDYTATNCHILEHVVNRTISVPSRLY